jgi:hypothetical protein
MAAMWGFPPTFTFNESSEKKGGSTREPRKNPDAKPPGPGNIVETYNITGAA